MALRCLLFTSDEDAAELICQVLAGLSVEGEFCSEAVAAVEKATHNSFQIVIIDWDNQPEAGLLLAAARERKANERPLTLAIVSDDVSVPKALQAGANSILRKPIQFHQVNDTLTTARDLLRAKQESAATAAQAAAAGASAGTVSPLPEIPNTEKTLRAGEFLQSNPAPGGHFVTESEVSGLGQETAEPVDPLKDLEPMAASVANSSSAPVAPAPDPDEPRGLEWYLKRSTGGVRASAAPVPAPTPAVPDKPELLGFGQTPSYSAPAKPEAAQPREEVHKEEDHKAEEKLFAYMDGEGGETEQKARPGLRLGKGAIVGALALAACAIVAAPQAPWHPRVQMAWKHGQVALHAWLNPQPVTTAQAPESHENFQRAGDEYKLPVAENIPDATTDPSQIQVVPVVDPTAKKPNNGATADPAAIPADGSGTTTSTPVVQPGVQVQENQPTQPNVQPSGGSTPPATSASPNSAPATSVVTSPAPTSVNSTTTVSNPEPPHADAAASAPTTVPATQPAPKNSPPPQYVSAPAHVPSSLKSEMASMTPDASGNKPPEAALPSIEPVAVAEAAERTLLSDQPAIAYPANAKSQQGTVILQVLIGRDGTVQDAKFLQGSLAFARTAIDGVKQWKFKPYEMNGRAVSVATTLTMSFKPGQ